MNARLDETNTRLGRLEVNLAETNTRLGRMEVSLAETNTRLDGTSERLVRMKVSLAKTNTRLDGKNERFGRMEVSLNGTNALLGGMDKRFDRMDERIEANNHNSIARTLNSTVTRVDARLSPLRNTNNKVIAYFPESPNAVKKLNEAQINRLLRAFELTEDGSLILRRTRLIEFIGNCLL
ncbi:hypothetical protein MMC31_000450 [Peltigera leucophlebia]|nr:hypothetical protein [Peltigera leucophlebia]